jgi:hypothetical protein
MDDVVYVLGAPDPEMEAIERRLLKAAGCRYAYATGADGRVHPGSAYAAVGAALPSGEPVALAGVEPVVVIECAVAGVEPVVVIDHHRPGDPGYGRPPDEFLPASSIGQAVSYIIGTNPLAAEKLGWPDLALEEDGTIGHLRYIQHGWYVCTSRAIEPDGTPTTSRWAQIPEEIVLTAAADHCLAAAYRGECPGVDPDELMRWRAASRAAFQRRTEAEVLADVERAIDTLRAAPRVTIAGVAVADLGDATTVPEAPEAACRAGVPFLATVTERDGRRKQVLQAAPAEVVSAWMAEHPGSYGDPARGFAGRYL